MRNYREQRPVTADMEHTSKGPREESSPSPTRPIIEGYRVFARVAPGWFLLVHLLKLRLEYTFVRDQSIKGKASNKVRSSFTLYERFS
jgi:hypothetical protein